MTEKMKENLQAIKDTAVQLRPVCLSKAENIIYHANNVLEAIDWIDAGFEKVIVQVLDTAFGVSEEAVKRWIHQKWPGGYGLYDD